MLGGRERLITWASIPPRTGEQRTLPGYVWYPFDASFEGASNSQITSDTDMDSQSFAAGMLHRPCVAIFPTRSTISADGLTRGVVHHARLLAISQTDDGKSKSRSTKLLVPEVIREPRRRAAMCDSTSLGRRAPLARNATRRPGTVEVTSPTLVAKAQAEGPSAEKHQERCARYLDTCFARGAEKAVLRCRLPQLAIHAHLA